MKKILTLLLTTLLALSFTGCITRVETSETKEPEISGSLDEIMSQIYAGVDFELPMTATTPLTSENVEYFLGSSAVEYTEGLGSEPMISSIAHSIVLLRVPDTADIPNLMATIKANVDGRKWICVGVEDNQILVENVGTLVILIMDEKSDQYMASFLKLAK